MKAKLLAAFIGLSFFITPCKSFGQVNAQDSLALVDFYDSTYGVAPWQFGQSWDLQSPIAFNWSGVSTTNNRVVGIFLRGGSGGSIPSSFGNLTALQSINFLDFRLDATLPESFENLISLRSVYFHAVFGPNPLPFPVALTKVPNLESIDMEDNYFTDSLPSSIGEMSKLVSLNLFQNSLSGTIPNIINGLDSLKGMDISYNHYTFKEIVPFINDYIISRKTYTLSYYPQNNIPVHRYNNKLAVSAGDVSNDTFKWYKDSILVATITGDNTYAPSDTGRYYVAVTNSVATALTLYGDEIALHYIMPDSLISTTHNITGTSPANITKGIFEIAMLQPTAGVNQLTGDVSALVNVDTTVQTFHSQPYVQRHYDITPAVNAANAQAIVTLYFTQDDFDNYNGYVTANNLNLPLLPSGGVGNGNVRITQFHGNFAGSSRPENYNNQNIVLIVPTSVAWDNTNQWWAITFPVTGFSGFFLSTGNFTLPLTLLEFKGKVQGNNIALQWLTTHEVNTKEFVIERSINGTVFNPIGNVMAHPIAITNPYNFIDLIPLSGSSFYRLKMIDKDAKFTYSNIVQIKINNTVFKLSVYPNPSRGFTTLLFSSKVIAKYTIELTDQSGKIIKSISGVSAIGINKVGIVIPNSAFGIYNLILIDNENNRHSLKLNSQ